MWVEFGMVNRYLGRWVVCGHQLFHRYPYRRFLSHELLPLLPLPKTPVTSSPTPIRGYLSPVLRGTGSSTPPVTPPKGPSDNEICRPSFVITFFFYPTAQIVTVCFITRNHWNERGCQGMDRFSVTEKLELFCTENVYFFRRGDVPKWCIINNYLSRKPYFKWIVSYRTQ